MNKEIRKSVTFTKFHGYLTDNNLTVNDSPEILKKISVATEEEPGSWGSYLNIEQ